MSRIGKFTECDRRRGHIEQPTARARATRHRDAEWVRAEDGRFPLPRGNGGTGIAHDDADVASASDFLTPPGAGSKMIGMTRHHHGDAQGPCNPNGMIGALLGDDLTKAILTIVAQAHPVFTHHATSGGYIDAARPQLLDVSSEHLNAMRIYPSKIRPHQ